MIEYDETHEQFFLVFQWNWDDQNRDHFRIKMYSDRSPEVRKIIAAVAIEEWMTWAALETEIDNTWSSKDCEKNADKWREWAKGNK